MIFYGLHKEQFVTTREIGRGGEGQVYELQADGGHVLKKYNEPLSAVQVAKLRSMVAAFSPAIETYAAWPSAIVTDSDGVVCGFTMKKLSGYVPLHMVFSPMDRKRRFPERGYNFLVHVARNLATAVHQLHEAGLVIGDVNEGNILINANGLVSFIDCDSFQVNDGGQYYYCEVGVPRYTPPELLEKQTFQQVVRTTNTDSFSLAVLIFQLLFLGRHPFAGRNKTAKDIDEETAIRQRMFAYSVDNERKKLLPPKDSLDINWLPQDIVRLFHRAFETDERPSPAEWVRGLDRMLVNLVSCPESRLHSYSPESGQCPWCWFRNMRGIMYFLDDSYLKAATVLGDIDSFVNGFKTDELELKQWEAPQLPEMQPAAPEPAYFRSNQLRYRVSQAVFVSMIFLTAALAWMHIEGPYPYLLAAAAVVAPLLILGWSPWTTTLIKALRSGKQELDAARAKLEQQIKEYNSPAEMTPYKSGVQSLDKKVSDYRRLPEEFERRKLAVEESLFNEQLHYFLMLYPIQDASIPSFGPAKKEALRNNGIYTAADITRMQALKVPGIGPKNLQTLLDWQRQVATGFTYIPDNYAMNREMDKLNATMQELKERVADAVRKDYQSISYLKTNISGRRLVQNRMLTDQLMRVRQAELDEAEFRRLFFSGLAGKAVLRWRL